MTQVGLSYDPPSITVSPGDTITWVRTGGTHDAVHGNPCFEADSQGLFPDFPLFDIPLTGANPTGSWTVPDAAPGRIPYFCSVGTHCEQGMAGEIIVVPREGSRVVVVEQQGLDFIPLEIEVSPGDTVVWNQNNGGHSVHTASDLSTCTQDDVFISLPLDFDYTQIVWEVPETMPKTLDYFCIYHCELGHVGTINRADDCETIDLNCDGLVNGADLAQLLPTGPAPVAVNHGGRSHQRRHRRWRRPLCSRWWPLTDRSCSLPRTTEPTSSLEIRARAVTWDRTEHLGSTQ